MDTAATMTQMNVRIDRALKQEGDSALSSIGFTPTRVIRALWGYAAKRGESLEEVREFMEQAEAACSPTSNIFNMGEVLQRGRQIVPDGLSHLGISAAALENVVADAEGFIEDARAAYAAEKGWLQ